MPYADGNANMAITYNEDGSQKKRKGNKKGVNIAESFIAPAGETGPMSKKEFKKFQQFINDTTPAGPMRDYRLKLLKKQRKFGV